MSTLAPSRTNKILAKLFCASLWRKGALCCTMNCSCFNDVENPAAERHRAEEARWKYKSEKLASDKERREQAEEKRKARRDKAKSEKEEKKAAAEKRAEERRSRGDAATMTKGGDKNAEREGQDAADDTDHIGRVTAQVPESDVIGSSSGQNTPAEEGSKSRRAKRAAKREARRKGHK